MYKNPPRKVAAKSMGARKMGARKMGDSNGGGATTGASSMGSFEETEKQAADAKAAAEQMAKDKEQAEKDRKANELSMFMNGGTPRKNDWSAPLAPSPVIHDLYGRGTTSSPSEPDPTVSTGPLAARFSTAKGIGSDQLFGDDEDTPEVRYERQTKLAGLGGGTGHFQ